MIPDLVERLKGATGPDRELGRELLLALGWSRSRVGHFCGPLYWWTAPKAAATILSGDDDRLPDVTASVDAAIALVERGLPGFDYRFERDEGDHRAAVWKRGTFIGGYEANAPTPALALCLALLTSIEDEANG